MCGHEHVPWTMPRLVCHVDAHLVGALADGDGDDDRSPMLAVRIGTCGARSPSEDGDVLFISLQGELDAYSASRVAGPTEELVARARDAVIDLAKVTFIDAAGVAFLQTLPNRVATCDGVVWVHDPSPLVRRILDVAPIDGC